VAEMTGNAPGLCAGITGAPMQSVKFCNILGKNFQTREYSTSNSNMKAHSTLAMYRCSVRGHCPGRCQQLI
jgi:hypothetical protein